MKIFFDHQIFGAQRNGGISRYFIELAKNLIKNDDEIKILAPIHFNTYLKDYNNEQKIQNSIYLNLDFRGLPRILQTVNQNFNHLFLKYSKVDIIHETYYNYKSPNCKLPRIITIHDLTDEILGSSFNIKPSIIKLKKRAIESADHIICVSKNTQKDLLEIYGIPEKKTSVVHHGYTILECNEKIERGKPYILFVGSRSYYKNFTGLLNAFSNSKRINQYFNIVAFGGTPFSKSEITLIDQLGLSEKIIHVSGNDSLLAQYYQGATSFIYPSFYEGFGMPLLEAMYYSCPVVSSNTSCMSEIAGDAAIYFDPSNLEEMIFALELSIFDRKIRRNQILNGLERITQFSWSKCANQTRHIYNNFTR